MPWLVQAPVLSRRMPDLQEVYYAAALLADPAGHFAVLELSEHGPLGSAVVPGDHLDAICAAVEDWGSGIGIYYHLNPTVAELTGKRGKARVGDILRRRWLLIDVDRPKAPDNEKYSATDEEHEQARDLATEVIAHLQEQTFPPPVIVDSGNGFQLLYRIDLPNDKHSQALLRRFLSTLAERFDGPRGTIGAECHDACRLAKLPGTWARRGPERPDRPHRIARLIDVPEELEIVPPELLEAFGEVTQQTEVPAGLKLRATGAGGYARYAQSALRGWVGQLKCCPVGKRNTTLNAAAFRMGRMVGAGMILAQTVLTDLKVAAFCCGLSEEEFEATAPRALEAGRAEPLPLPEQNGKHEAKLKPGERVIQWASEIKPRKLEWLWQGRLIRGMLTTFAGQTGQGKTFITCDIITRITRGLAWPDTKQTAPVGKALFISGDDRADCTIVPRLIELGADLTKVCFLSERAQEGWNIAVLELLDTAIAQMGDGVRLVVIDPPTSFMLGIDDHKNAELRSVLTPLSNWAARQDVTVILITHVNKGGAGRVEALERVIGGIGYVTQARTAFMAVPDPEDRTRSLFLPLKSNLGPRPAGLAYRISASGDMAKVDWLGEVDVTADDAMSKNPKRVRRDVAARNWLIEQFRQQLEWPSNELFERGRQEGISHDALFEAKALLQLPKARKVYTERGDSHWVWWVPVDWPPLADACDACDACDEGEIT